MFYYVDSIVVLFGVENPNIWNTLLFLFFFFSLLKLNFNFICLLIVLHFVHEHLLFYRKLRDIDLSRDNVIRGIFYVFSKTMII